MHYYASVAFFVLFPISMFLICAEFLSSSRVKMGLLTFVTATFAAIVWIVQFAVTPVPGVAIPETLSALAASAWVVVLGLKMFRDASHSTAKPASLCHLCETPLDSCFETVRKLKSSRLTILNLQLGNQSPSTFASDVCHSETVKKEILLNYVDFKFHVQFLLLHTLICSSSSISLCAFWSIVTLFFFSSSTH